MEELNITGFKPSYELDVLKKYCMDMDSKTCLFRNKCPWLENPDTIDLFWYVNEIRNLQLYTPNQIRKWHSFPEVESIVINMENIDGFRHLPRGLITIDIPKKYSECFNAAVNILAVELLVRTGNKAEYNRRIEQLYQLDEQDLACLEIALSLNMHIGNLGEMITQGDYDYQVNELFEFLDERGN